MWHFHKLILDQLSEALFVVDKNFIVVEVNEIALQWSGLKSEQVLGSDLFTHGELFSENLKQRMGLSFETGLPALLTPDIHKQILFTTGVNEVPEFQEARFSIMDAADQEFVLGLLVIKNVTDNHKTLKKARFLNQLKSKFLSLCSHDIRAPLFVVKAVLDQLVGNAKLKKKELKEIRAAQLAAAELQELVDSLLDLSKRDFVHSKEAEKIDLVKSVQKAYEIMLIRARQKDVVLSCDIELKKKEAWIEAKSIDMDRILNNLITNAIKFTNPLGRVSIRLKESEDSKRFLLKISDTGVGIPTEELSHLFSLEPKKSQLGTRGEGGTGLGLYIIKKLMDQWETGAEIRAEKKIDGPGTDFWLSFKKIDEKPIEHAKAVGNSLLLSRSTEKKSDRYNKSFKSRAFSQEVALAHKPLVKILVVDDDELTHMILKNFLNIKGVKSDFVFSGEAALKRVRDGGPYDVIFIDLELGSGGDEKGFDVARKIWNFEKNRKKKKSKSSRTGQNIRTAEQNIPHEETKNLMLKGSEAFTELWAVTGHSQEALEFLYTEPNNKEDLALFKGILQKPFAVHELLAPVKKALFRAGSERPDGLRFIGKTLKYSKKRRVA